MTDAKAPTLPIPIRRTAHLRALFFLSFLLGGLGAALAAPAFADTPAPPAAGGNPSGSSLVAPAAPPAPPPMPIVSAKFAATFYGFVEADFIRDSSQSLNDLAGNAALARAGSYAANHDRLIFGQRNSRLGFKLKGPESTSIRSSGIAEMDFLGNQPQGSPSPAGSPAVSESAYYASPTFRIRHMAVKVETPFVDLLVGQYWQLFGWQTYFHPNSVQIQGLPGQVFSRSPQLRLSHAFRTPTADVEVAVAASRPPQRDSGLPDGQAGVRVMLNDWKGMRTAGGAGTSLDPASIGISGVARRFRLPEYASAPTATQKINGYGLSVDAMVPVVPATPTSSANAVTLTASFVRGQAIADLFTGLTGGTSLAPLPADASGKASSFALDIDNGIVVFDGDGTMHAIRWQSVLVGVQYYLPTPIRTWVSGNYSHLSSNDIKNLAMAGSANTTAKLFDKSDFADGNFFVDATASVRFGLEYAWFRQHYLDDVKGTNHRVQLSGFYIF